MADQAPTRIPFWPLAATLAIQTLATMSLYSVPTLAPEIAADLGVSGTLSGVFVAIGYGTGIPSAILSPALIRRFGGVRATQCVLLCAAGMLAIAATGAAVRAMAAATDFGARAAAGCSGQNRSRSNGYSGSATRRGGDAAP